MDPYPAQNPNYVPSGAPPSTTGGGYQSGGAPPSTTGGGYQSGAYGGAPPSTTGYNQPHHHHHHQQPVMGMPVGMSAPLLLPQLGHDPQACRCPQCHRDIVTQTTKEMGTGAWLMVLILLFVFFPCACIPCLMDSLKDTVHVCPNCHWVIGRKALM